MKRILIVTTIYQTYKSFLMPHAELLSKHGFELDLATNLNDVSNIELSYQNLENVHNVPFPRGIKFRKILNSYKLMKRLLNIDYDFIYLHTPIAAFITRLAIKRNRIKTKVIYFVHGFHFHSKSNIFSWLFYYPIEKNLAYVTDQFITINQEDTFITQNNFKKPTKKLDGVGVDFEKFHWSDYNEEKPELIIISVGELNKNKNHQFLIESLAKSKFENWKLLICGEGPKKTYLENLIQKKFLQNKIFLMGYCDKVSDIFSQADIYVHASKREGLPVSVIEAMYYGLPVIASDIRGNRDLVMSTFYGQLYKSNNSNDFVDKFMRVIENLPDLKHKTKEFNTEVSLRYSFESVKTDLLEVFNINSD